MIDDERVVLSADDSEDAHVLLRRAFVKAGIRAGLKHVYGGGEAISYLKGEGAFSDRGKYPLPVLLLLDLKMPGVSGFDVLEYLRGQPQKRKFPVVVFSSSENQQDVRKARELGADSYEVKPPDFKGLVELVHKLDAEFINVVSVGRKPERLQPVASKETAPPRGTDEEKPKLTPLDSPEMFRLLIEQVKDYAIFILDTEGYIRSWNEGARRIHGYEPEEIIGRHFSIFYPPGDAETDKPQFELRMAAELSRYEDEGWRVRKDGSRFWANVVVSPICVGGKITGFAKVTRDLTQRKFQEDNLQRLLDSEERFRLLVEQVKDYAIFFLDARGHVSSWNQGARRIKGYTADEIIGKHFSIFYTPDDLKDDKPARELTIAMRDGRYEEEGWRLKKDGTRFWANVVITPLWDKRGNLTAFAKVTRDLTERKRKEEALKARTVELEAFAHTLSHDLRAPLRSITSFAELLLEGGTDRDREERECLLKIYRSAQGMDTLIRDILKLSEVSLAPAPEEAVSLDDVVDQVLGMFESQVLSTHARITIRRPLPLIQANRTLLLQIFSNLIGNALKFSRAGGPPEIEILAVHRESVSEIHVKDFGPGIPERMQSTIFNIFERGPAPPTSAGSGIGLAIVKRAVERAGGAISLVSQEGHGSDFIVTLPCHVPVRAAYPELQGK
jgi:PAS domain S-box-containing protein